MKIIIVISMFLIGMVLSYTAMTLSHDSYDDIVSPPRTIDDVKPKPKKKKI